MPKFVLSSTLKNAEWRATTILTGDLAEEASKLKQQCRSDVVVYGHGRLARTLLNIGLRDELRISMFPVCVGSGQQFFHAGDKAKLQLIDATSLPTGIVVARYRPV